MKFLKLFGCICSLLCFCASVEVKAQIFVSYQAPYNSEVYLIQDVFLGTGVTVSNITYYGDTNYIQLGYFNGQNSTIGLDSGIVMTSGHIDAIVPGGTGNGAITNVPGVYPNGQGGGDADLLTVAQSVPVQLGLGFNVSATEDASILEFDFEPSADTVEFRYVFATDEFPTFVNTQFNDVFGFFLSGPGITGPFSSPAGFPNGSKNIALVPGTTLPITVSTVHPGLNSQYFAPQDTSISFGGGTIVLTAKHEVTPCQTYHIKLAISDAVDKALNSGVFLEAKSFASGAIQIDAIPSYTNLSGSGDTNLFEGCGFVELTFRRFADLGNPYTAYFTVSGSATMGADYNNFADSVVFAPGVDTAQILINVFDDGITEGPETIIIKVLPDTMSCWMQNVMDTSQIIMVINERPAVTMTTLTDSVNCADSVALPTAQGLTGVGNFTYLWPSGDTLATDTIPNPLTDTALLVLMTDGCRIDTISDSARIVLFNPPLVVLTEDDTLDCVTPSAVIGPQILSGSSVQFYTWSTGQTDSSILVTPVTDSTYYLTVTDSCVNTVWVDSITVFRISPPLVLDSVNDTVDCNVGFVSLSPTIVSGTAPFNYLWSTGSSLPNINLFGAGVTDTSFTVVVTDACNITPDTTSVSLTVFSPPLQISADTALLDCSTDSILIGVNVISGTAPFSYQWGTGATDSAIFVNPSSDSTYLVTVTDVCDTVPAIDSVRVTLVQASAIVLMQSDLSVPCPGDNINLQPQVSGGTPPYQFLWSTGANTSTLNAVISNDTLYQVTVTDTCRLDTVSIAFNVTIDAQVPVVVQLTDRSLGCPGESATISAQVSGGNGAYTYSWSALDTTSTNDSLVIDQVDTTQNVVLTVTDACGKSDTDTMTLSVNLAAPLVVSLPATQTVCEEQGIAFVASVSGGSPPYAYTWTGPGTLVPNTNSATSGPPVVAGQYALLVTDACNVSASAATDVTVEVCSLVVPNVISPNRDGINDLFMIPNIEKYPNSKLTVFNRWGNQVFYSSNYRNTFDGQGLEEGTYFFVLEISDGETFSGDLTIIR
ncbi:MAG: choice-of-anchor L domain-containing protein [Salibacteraceae bacterium]